MWRIRWMAFERRPGGEWPEERCPTFTPTWCDKSVTNAQNWLKLSESQEE